MKPIKLFAILAVAVLSFGFCRQASAQTLTSTNGNSAGGALLSLYSQYKTDGKLDMTNPNNIANLITLANNIKGLANMTNTKSFLSGLIQGSKSLVNANNQSNVLSTLSSLSNLDLSSLAGNAAKTAATAAATKAASGLLSKLKSGASNAAQQANTAVNTASDKAVSSATSLLSGLFGSLN